MKLDFNGVLKIVFLVGDLTEQDAGELFSLYRKSINIASGDRSAAVPINDYRTPITQADSLNITWLGDDRDWVCLILIWTMFRELPI